MELAKSATTMLTMIDRMNRSEPLVESQLVELAEIRIQLRLVRISSEQASVGLRLRFAR